MKHNQKTIRIILIVYTILLFLSLNLYFYWIKIAGDIFLVIGLFELSFFMIIIILTVILICKIILKKGWRNLKNLYVIGFVLLINFVIIQYKMIIVDENLFQSRVLIKACREGTQNTSKLFLRENRTFENFNIGFFAYVHYSNGTWQKNGDTIFLTYKREKLKDLSDSILIINNNLFNIQGDTIDFSGYYIGECKRLN